jgi:hypothetical protein
MTRAMRAVGTGGPRVLRVGLVQDGRVMEERVIPRGVDVTIGWSEKNTFVLKDANLPGSCRVLVWSGGARRTFGGHYRLCFSDAMSGKVALDTGVSELSALRAVARRGRQGMCEVELGDTARGKLVLGDTALLFQLVPEAPRTARPQLPLALKKKALEVDLFTSVVAAFSFLFHFGMVGALYSDWSDPVIDDEIVVAGVVDSLAIPKPLVDVEDQSPPTNAEPAPSTTAATNSTQAPSNQPSNSSHAPARDSAATLSRELDNLNMQTLGALSSEGPATEDVLRNGEVPTALLDQAARDERGVSSNPGLSLSRGTGPVRPGSRSELGDLAEHRRGTTTNENGTAERPKGPVGNVSAPAPGVHGVVSDAASVIAGMRGAWRACYQRGLAENPDAEGSVRLTFRVGPNGESLSVSAAPSGNLPGSVVSCVRSRAASAQFSPPAGGEAVVVAPVIFKKQ